MRLDFSSNIYPLGTIPSGIPSLGTLLGEFSNIIFYWRGTLFTSAMRASQILASSLDRDVLPIVCSMFEDGKCEPGLRSVHLVYEAIRLSQPNFGKKPRRMLEDSIERTLACRRKACSDTITDLRAVLKIR